MAWSNRGKVYLVHGIFYGVQAILIGISALIIFTGLGPTIGMHYNFQDDLNIVNGNPGLSLRPLPADGSGIPSFIISYKGNNRSAYKPWVNSLDDFLQAYKTFGLFSGAQSKFRNCDYDAPPPPGTICHVDIRRFSRCISENLYDYHRSAPCIFLRLNTPPGWKPVYYNDTNSLPNTMPTSLKEYIRDLKMKDPRQLNTVWVSCEGKHPADKESIGPVEYFPRPGFPGYYYLNTDVEDYVPPLVAVHFERPTIGPFITINCKAWARNIKHDGDSALGGIEFGLMLE